MKNSHSNKDKIISLIEKYDQISIKQLAQELGISLSMTHRHIRALLLQNSIRKIGTSPRVYYALQTTSEIGSNSQGQYDIGDSVIEMLQKNFLYISPQGKRRDGVNGFAVWCDKRGFDISQKATEYEGVFQRYLSYKQDGIISGHDKMLKTFGGGLCTDDVFYAEFYAWEIFGKTRLGLLLLYAKQSQDQGMMKEVVGEVRGIIQKIIIEKEIDAVAFVPPTVKRHIQFMAVLEEQLALEVPSLKLVKVQTEISTPQKTLNKLADRIENAHNTIVVDDRRRFNNLLVIDDAIGSGATINQIACKVKKLHNAKKVFGFAVTGSANGFDVISEV